MRKVPKYYTTIFRVMKLDGRFIRLKKGWYGLKEWKLGSCIMELETGSYVHTEQIQDENKPEIENDRESSELNMNLNNIELVDDKMGPKETYEDNILPEEVVTLLQCYYNDEELESAIQRAKKEYRNKFIPQFVAQEMNRLGEKENV